MIYQLSYEGSSKVSHSLILCDGKGGFFTIWATREVQKYWSGWPIPSPGDLPDPGIKLGSPALQVFLYQLSYEGSLIYIWASLVNLTLTCSKCLEQINKEFVSTYSIIPRNHNRFYTTKQSNLYVIVSKEEMLCDSQVEKKKIWGINWLSNSKSFRYMVHRGRCFYIRTYATQINY